MPEGTIVSWKESEEQSLNFYKKTYDIQLSNAVQVKTPWASLTLPKNLIVSFETYNGSPELLFKDPMKAPFEDPIKTPLGGVNKVESIRDGWIAFYGSESYTKT
jgi:hypothetical protein